MELKYPSSKQQHRSPIALAQAGKKNNGTKKLRAQAPEEEQNCA